MKFKLCAALAAVASTGAAGTAWAQDGTFFGYNLNASVRAVLAPTYEGGNRYTVFPGGGLAITKPWEFDAFAAPDDAASLAIINTRRFSFGAAASLREARYNNGELQGMRSIGWGLESGAFMNAWPTHWIRFHVEGLRGLTAQSGWEVNSGLDFVHHPKSWNLAVGPRFSWSDAKFNNTYFGIIPGEAAASPYFGRPYHLGAGPRFAGAEASAEYKWLPRWRLTVDASYHRLLAQVADSPLVRQVGSPDQFEISAGIRFMLGKPSF